MPSKGSYPASYRGRRSPGPQWGFVAPVGGMLAWQRSANPWRPTPMRPFGRPMSPGPFRPVNPANPLGPPDIDLPLEPAVSPGALSSEVLVARLAPWALAALVLYDMVRPSGARKIAVPGSNWTHVCGAFPYPGPPYRNCTVWEFGASVALTCLVPLPLQGASTANNLPILQPGNVQARNVIYYYGPHEGLYPTLRYYSYDQWSSPTNPPTTFASLAYRGPALVALPAAVLPFVGPAVLVTLLPVAPPVGSALTFGQSRGYLDADVQPKPSAHSDGVSYVPRLPDSRPRPREREHKASGTAAKGFQLLSQFGSWNSLVHALHRSLPKSCRHGRSYGSMMSDLYSHANCLELGAASWELANFWVRYKFAGWTYGRVQRHLLRVDPSGSLLRNLFTYLDQSDTAVSGARRRLQPRRRGVRDSRKCPGC